MKKGAPRTLTSKFWFPNGWWGDQGGTSQCVAYSWMHWLEDGPITHPRTIREAGKLTKRGIPLIEPEILYQEAQGLDDWAGIPHDGSTIRAGAQALVARKLVAEYRWAFDMDTIIDWILTKGPMVVGTNWYSGMEELDAKGYLHVTGFIDGGHAYVLDGVDKKAGYARIKNSWGKEWGRNGFAKISLTDFEKLLNERDAEACTAVELK